MNGRLASSHAVSIWVALGLSHPAAAGEDERRPLTIEVHLQDYAGVPGRLLRGGAAVADEIYRPANIAIEWRNCTAAIEGLPVAPECSAEVRPNLLVIQLAPEKMAKRVPLPRSVFGYAPRAQSGLQPNRATLFWDRIRDYCRDNAFDARALLGAAIAHEIGHLLLGPGRHGARGMMRCPWKKPDVRSAARGRLSFTPDELALIRQGARRRVRPKASPSGGASPPRSRSQ